MTQPPGTATAAKDSWPDWLPWWWRLPAWAAIVAASVVAAPQPWSRVLVGVLMVIAAAAIWFRPGEDAVAGRAVTTVLATGAGLAVILLAHSGLGYVPVLVVAGRFPYRDRRGTVFVVAVTILFGLAVGWVAHSPVGLLAGAAIPMLAQRAAQQREIVAQRDRAEVLLAEVQAGREAEAQAAALRERGRIARDLHDVLAHSLAGLSLQLQAIRALAARADAGPELVEPIDTAAALARDGLAEARAAVSALRDPAGLGLAELPALVQRHPGRAELISTGPSGAVEPETGHAVYRCVQESLTNAARYAPGSAVTVSLSWQPGRLAVRVTDTGAAPGHSAAPGQGSGLGLAGMRERVEQVGGSVHAGPRGDEPGWRVEIEVATTEAAT